MNKTFIKQWMSGLHSLNKTDDICAFPNKYHNVTTNNYESDNILTIPFELIMLNLIKHISCPQASGYTANSFLSLPRGPRTPAQASDGGLWKESVCTQLSAVQRLWTNGSKAVYSLTSCKYSLRKRTTDDQQLRAKPTERITDISMQRIIVTSFTLSNNKADISWKWREATTSLIHRHSGAGSPQFICLPRGSESRQTNTAAESAPRTRRTGYWERLLSRFLFSMLFLSDQSF